MIGDLRGAARAAAPPLFVAAVSLVFACDAGSDHRQRRRHRGDRRARARRRHRRAALFFTLWDTSIQEQIPAHAVSRVSSYDFAVSLGLMPIGMAVAGPVSQAAGLHATLIGMSVLGIAAALVWLAAPGVRGERRPAQTPGADALVVGDGVSLRADPDGARFAHGSSDVRT